ncbi:MAG: NAD(P)H-hydrate dehydratase [Oscillospiraceae bacterium]
MRPGGPALRRRAGVRWRAGGNLCRHRREKRRGDAVSAAVGGGEARARRPAGAARAAGKSDVCVLGPGLGRNDTLTALVQAVVMQSGTPLVLDADALFAVAQDAAVLERARAPIVLTPHDGEFARLAGPDKTGRAEAASDFAVRHGCTVVRKGPETVCAFPDGDAAVLRVGNPGMAKGGSGDVLAGMLGALLCQMPARDAVQTAVWLHGRAGDLCAGRMGEYAMNPTDVIAALPEVTKPIIR